MLTIYKVNLLSRYKYSMSFTRDVLISIAETVSDIRCLQNTEKLATYVELGCSSGYAHGTLCQGSQVRSHQEVETFP